PTTEHNRRSTVGTISYMPAIFGCYCASVVIRELVSN
ncbi:MAG TPA: tRNA threonylcarbamoyladenosine dehydratase, partial [Bacteroidales bacterium]|nr:tRNA threonylcarbamoyladenosine dehydratase [Bacteroidales bacterium]